MNWGERKKGPFPEDFFLGGAWAKLAPVTYARRKRNLSVGEDKTPTPRWGEAPAPLSNIQNLLHTQASNPPSLPPLKLARKASNGSRKSQSQCDIRPTTQDMFKVTFNLKRERHGTVRLKRRLRLGEL